MRKKLNHEGRRPLGRPSRRLEDIIKMDFSEIVYEGVDWIYLAQDISWRRAFLNTGFHLRVS
jgi:hypothetical protein